MGNRDLIMNNMMNQAMKGIEGKPGVGNAMNKEQFWNLNIEDDYGWI